MTKTTTKQTTKASKATKQSQKNARRIVRAYLRTAIEATMHERIPADLGARLARVESHLDAALKTLAR